LPSGSAAAQAMLRGGFSNINYERRREKSNLRAFLPAASRRIAARGGAERRWAA